MMKIEHTEDGDRGRFYINEGGKATAELTYKLSAASKMDIVHTEVDEKFRGEGIGEDLVAAAVEYATEKNLSLVASCPYAKKIIDATPE